MAFFNELQFSSEWRGKTATVSPSSIQHFFILVTMMHLLSESQRLEVAQNAPRVSRWKSVSVRKPGVANKKTDVANHPKMIDHVGLLANKPPADGLLFI